MEEILSNFFEISKDPYTQVSKWKEKNEKKVVGVYPMWIPEEIIHASGMLPVVLWRGNEPVTIGHAHVPPFNCGITRSFTDDALREKLKFLDGMIFYRMCLQEISLEFIMEHNAQPKPEYIGYFYFPAVFDRNPALKEFLIDELQDFKRDMENLNGIEITNESLKKSIQIYNKNKEILRNLYELRRNSSGKIKAKEVQAIVHSSMLLPKEDHTKMMEELLPQLEKRKTATNGKIKVILTGALCQTVQGDLLDLIEDLGMEVVDDDMYVGSRYFALDANVNGDPIQALADRYMEDEPVCPTKGEWAKNWGEHLIDMVKQNKADGVISLLIKFCPPHLCWYPAVREKLAEEGIPHTMIEVEHEVTSLDPVRTRLEAFTEMIKGGI